MRGQSTRLPALCHSFFCFAGLIVVSAASAQTPPQSGPKPVPALQVVPQPYDQAAITRDGLEISRYHFGKTLPRPFLFPLIGPSGRSVTRMGHPRDPNGHSHHNSVWISHHDLNGVDFWGDSGKGRIVHRKVLQYEDADTAALIAVQNAWTDETGRTLLEETRRMTFVPLSDKQWLLVLELEFSPPKNGPAVSFGKTPFGLVGVRMAKTVGVHDGGGTIRNSEGGVNEKEVFWKPARWVDYSGPITPNQSEGVTLMDHPANPGHPTPFHVRDDGWMGASVSFSGPLEVSTDKPLRVRYGLFIHTGIATPAVIDENYQRFVKLGDISTNTK